MIRKNNIALGFNSSELSVQWRNVLWVSSLIVIEERSENRLAVQNMVKISCSNCEAVSFLLRTGSS